MVSGQVLSLSTDNSDSAAGPGPHGGTLLTNPGHRRHAGRKALAICRQGQRAFATRQHEHDRTLRVLQLWQPSTQFRILVAAGVDHRFVQAAEARPWISSARLDAERADDLRA